MLLDLLSQIEPDDSWRPRFPDQLPLPDRRSAVLSGVTLVDVIFGPPSSGVGPSGTLLAGSTRQYQGLVRPLFQAPPPTYFSAIYPDRIDRLTLYEKQPFTANVEPLPTTAITSYASASFPDRIDRLSLPVAAYQVFTANLVPEPQWGWPSVYPDRIDRALYSAASQLAWVSSAQPEQTVARAWGPIYPDTIDRKIYPAAAQLAFTISPQPEQPLPEPWNISFPSQISRTTLPVAAIPTLTLEPFPRPPVLRLSAWGFYPDRIDRFTVHPARLPFFSFGTLVPILNPVVVGGGEEKIHLGTKESMGVTTTPTLGGWQSW